MIGQKPSFATYNFPAVGHLCHHRSSGRKAVGESFDFAMWWGRILRRRTSRIEDVDAPRLGNPADLSHHCDRQPALSTSVWVLGLRRAGICHGPRGDRLRTYQADIVHLVSTVAIGMGLGRPWAISDGNAGADHTSFSDDPATIETLDWNAIQATNWSNVQHEKAAEFLVADRFPWTAVTEIGCYSEAAAVKVRNLIAAGSEHRPLVARQLGWYYQ